MTVLLGHQTDRTVAAHSADAYAKGPATTKRKHVMRNTLTLHATWLPNNPHETVLAHHIARMEQYIRECAVQNVIMQRGCTCESVARSTRKLHATWPLENPHAKTLPLRRGHLINVSKEIL